MLDKKWLPTPLLAEGERPPIPIAGEMGMTLRRIRVALRLGWLCARLIFLKVFTRLKANKIGRMFGDFCQQNGVLWVKLGQLMSMRSDLFPVELCVELSRLQDRAEGFSPDAAVEILERELGGPLGKFFSTFERVPCAAASIAQVHRGFLAREKVWVAVKVRRPEVDRVFVQDMATIRRIILTLHRFSFMSFMRWPDMLWELEQVFYEELDYRYEVTNQQRLRKTLARHDIYVPKIFAEYCTRQILVMEYIDAVSMTDYYRVLKEQPERAAQWLKENGIDAEVVGKRLFRSYLRQLLEDNLFHADLHPGNIFLLRDSRFALLDFGSIGSNEGDFLRKYDLYLEAISTGQYAKAVDVFLMIMPEVPAAGQTMVKEEIQRRLHAWDSRCRVKELSYKEKSTVTVSDEMMKVMSRYGVTINWAFFKVLRGWTTMDTSLREMIPEVDLPRLMQDYTRRRRKREAAGMIKQLPGDLLKLHNLIDYPREFFETAIYRGAAVRRLAQVFEGAATRVSRLVGMGFGVVAWFGFILSFLFISLFMFQHTQVWRSFFSGGLGELLGVFPRLDTQVWVLLMVFFLRGSISLFGLARRFRREE